MVKCQFCGKEVESTKLYYGCTECEAEEQLNRQYMAELDRLWFQSAENVEKLMQEQEDDDITDNTGEIEDGTSQVQFIEDGTSQAQSITDRTSRTNSQQPLA